MKKTHLLLIFLLLSFTSNSYAFIESWTDSSVCKWVIGDENNYELHPLALAEAKRRDLTCKNKLVVKKIDPSYILLNKADRLNYDYSETTDELLCKWVRTYPKNQKLIKEYRERIENQNYPCKSVTTKFNSEEVMAEIEAEIAKQAKVAEEKRLAEEANKAVVKKNALAYFQRKLEEEKAAAAKSTAAYQAKVAEEKRLAEEASANTEEMKRSEALADFQQKLKEEKDAAAKSTAAYQAKVAE